ncbi:MAG TPA: tetratricopeptide repeat protein [Armatimonadota bacterium]|jgi:hypothetical protein
MDRATISALVAGLALAMPSARAESNPHDGYAFWLPNGVVDIGSKPSEQAFQLIHGKDGVQFEAALRKTRFGTPAGRLVVIPVGGRATVPNAVQVASGVWAYGAQTQPTVTVVASSRGEAPFAYRLYFTDDASDWPNVFIGKPATAEEKAYAAGLAKFFRGAYAPARESFLRAAKIASPSAARRARRFARWCGAETQFPKIAKRDAKAYYNLGLYGMVNGFWELAEKSFKASTAANPKDPDAWYMLGDAASYVLSDLDTGFAKVYPYYRKAADLYPRASSNTFRNHLALFKKLRVREGDREVVQTLTPEQIAETKLKWEWCTAVFEAASRGSMRMVNNWVEYDKEFDNTAPSEHDPTPYEGLFETGTIETFMKFTGWGASDAIGPDCGANRGADVNIGMREWDVLYHEWNHTLDWLMAFSGMGIGVSETHSSDWCGFQPISSMGMGHHSCNRYYMTPGMYRAIHGSDLPTTPWVDEWLITDPVALPPSPKPMTQEGQDRLRDATKTLAPPISEQEPPKSGLKWAQALAQDGYVDLGSIERGASRNAASFAHVYVWAQADGNVRCWFGADDNARVWVNNRLVYTGNYWAVCQWEESHEKDQICFAMPLRRGWNSVLVQVSNVERFTGNPPPLKPYYYGRPDAWGFSMRFCDYQNKPVTGLRWQAEQPPMFEPARLKPAVAISDVPIPRPVYFQWSKVKDDYTQLLPHLTLADLRALTGYNGLTASDDMFYDPASATPEKPARLFHSGKADASEVSLNNELNWFFSPKENVAALRYKDRKGARRDLVLLRPEAYEAFTRLAAVAPDARARGIKAHGDRVIGYFTVPRADSINGRVVLVLDTWLGENPPVDEEDLLGYGV